MSLPSRSIPLLLLAFLSGSAGLAQPRLAAPESDVERLRSAYEQFEEGSLTRALSSFQNVVDPQRLRAWDPPAELSRVEILSHLRPTHNPDRELAALVDAYASSPHAPNAHIRRGLAALQASHHGQARIHFDEAVRTAAERDPEQIDEAAAGTAYYWLGIAHLTDPDGALHAQGSAALRTAAEEFPRGPLADDALFALGQSYEQSGELDSAITLYDRIVTRYPGSEIRLEAALRAAQSQLRLGRTEQARTLLRDVRSELDRSWPDAERQALQTAEYHLLTAAADAQAGDFSAAERSYLTVVYTLDSPYRRTAMLGLADTYATAGHPDSATAIYTRLAADPRRDHPGMYAEYQLAVLPLHHPYPSESLTSLAAIAADSTHLLSSTAGVTLAGIHYLRQDFDAATLLLDRVIERATSPALQIRALLLRGAIRLAVGRYRDADEDLASALRRARTVPVVMMPDRDSLMPHIALAGAIAMIHAGHPSDAVPQLNRLLQLQPTNAAEATYWLGEAYYASGALPAAASTLEDLIERYPTSARTEDALYAIGWAQFRQRKLDRAEAAFSRLVKAYPLTGYATAANLRRGDCLYLLRKYAPAADAYHLVDSLQAPSVYLEYARYQAALALYHAEQRDAAGAAFKRFLAAHSDSELADDATFMSGLIDYTERRYPDAVASLERLLGTYPASPLVSRALATISGAYYALGSFDSSLARAERVARDFPSSSYRDDAQAAALRASQAIRERDKRLTRELDQIDESMRNARALRDDGDVEGALAEYRRARDRSTNPETRARANAEIARTALLAADTLAALEAWRSAASAPGTTAGRAATWEIADHFRIRHLADSAARWYAHAAALDDSTAALAMLRTGQAYLGIKRWTEALDAFTRVTLRPDARAEWQGEAYLGIASVHAGKGEREQAREIFEQLIRDHAGNEISRRAEEQLRALGNL